MTLGPSNSSNVAQLALNGLNEDKTELLYFCSATSSGQQQRRPASDRRPRSPRLWIDCELLNA